MGTIYQRILSYASLTLIELIVVGLLGRSFAPRRGVGDLVYDFEPLGDLSEHAVLPIEVWRIRVHEKELRTRGVRIAGCRRRHTPRTCLRSLNSALSL